MSGYKRVNFYELCRLCATNQQKKTHIFQEEGRQKRLQDKIQSLLDLKVHEDDYLPKVVCSECLQNLENSYSFRNGCIASEAMLSTYFKNFQYTEDFTKSGQVYIKDEASEINGNMIKQEGAFGEKRMSSMAYASKVESMLQNSEVVNITSLIDIEGFLDDKSVKDRRRDDEMDDSSEQKKKFERLDGKDGGVIVPQMGGNHRSVGECKTIKVPDNFANNYFQNYGQKLNTITPNWVENMVQAPSVSKNSKIHQCGVCKKTFKRREHLHQHMKLHTGFRPFRCENCNKAFMRKEHLLRHMTSHSGLKSFQCDICEKAFSRNDNLLKHKKTHNKETNFTCEICGKQFVMKHYYLAHKVTHETERNHTANTWNTLKV